MGSYYPFGLKHKGYNNVVNGTSNPYKYNGKELNEELGLDWYDYGARNYDSSLARFMNIDLRSTDYYSWSPYNYTGNSPLMRVDINGEGWGDSVKGFLAGVVDNVLGTSLRSTLTVSDEAVTDFNAGLDVAGFLLNKFVLQ